MLTNKLRNGANMVEINQLKNEKKKPGIMARLHNKQPNFLALLHLSQFKRQLTIAFACGCKNGISYGRRCWWQSGLA